MSLQGIERNERLSTASLILIMGYASIVKKSVKAKSSKMCHSLYSAWGFFGCISLQLLSFSSCGSSYERNHEIGRKSGSAQLDRPDLALRKRIYCMIAW